VAESTAVLPAADAPPLTGRGRTTIAPSVVERLAARSCLEVPGVVRHVPGPEVLSAFAGSLPSASAENAGERVAVRVSVAVEWPAGAADVARAVREHTRNRLAELTGKTVDRVDVTVAALVPPVTSEGRRVR
jgi:uncharacterized alkaline shock family protein YloU